MKQQTIEQGEVARSKRQLGGLSTTLLCVVMSVLAVGPFFFMGRADDGDGDAASSGLELRMPTTHDMFLHFDQMRSFYNGLNAGAIYPRWEEDTNHGFGAPTTSYYPPGIYYVTSLFRAISGGWIPALLAAQLLLMIASAAALYQYARRSMSRGPAVLAMAAYIFLPYHLIDQYQRGAIAELLAFVWMPLILLFGERLMQLPRAADNGTRGVPEGWRAHLGSISGLALAFGLFLWSHPPTAYQFSLAFCVFVLVVAMFRRDWKGPLRIGLGLAVGGALSAAYLLPAAVEQELIRHEYVSESWPYHNTYVFVHDLYNREQNREFFASIDNIWALSGIVIVIASVALLVRSKKLAPLSPGMRARLIGWTASGLVVTFLMTKYSAPIGRLIPRIEIGVFTWRMLGISTLVVALLAGACLEAARRETDRTKSARAAIAGFGWLVTIGALVFSAVYVMRPMVPAPIFEPEEEHINYAMIPRTAPADPDELPDLPQAELEAGNGKIKVEEWKPQQRVMQVDLTENDRLLLRTFNFPGWTARVDGIQTPILTGDELGEIQIDLAGGRHQVTVDYENTPVRRTGELITLTSAGLNAVAFLIGLIPGKKIMSAPV
jgi:hypothetical protein